MDTLKYADAREGSRLKAGVLAAVLAAGIALGAGAPPAQAQPYPVKPIRMVIPFAPGGGTDVLARALAAQLSDTLGTSIVIENRGGAGGTLGAEAAARATPDGYTLLFTSASYSFNPSLYPKLAYDPLKDFVPITLIAMVPHLIVVHPSMPVKSVKELLALSRKRPGEIFYGSGGTGSSIHLASALFVSMAKADMVHVPYKGGGPALTAALSGEISLLFPTMQSAMPLVTSGRLRAIAISTDTRSPALPDLPTADESGLPGYNATGWYGVLAPAGTPRVAIDRVHRGAVKILAGAELKKRLANEGAIAVGSTPAEFDQFIREEMAKWAKIIHTLGIKLN
jgi:tripartite-type tricarboxylate transporter receptor subunit TctC